MRKALTVFLSSTGADLADYREAVMERLQGSDHIDCDGMENFGARDASPEDFCRKRAQECDVFVGLIGHYRGADVPGDNDQRSFTEMEYDSATDAGKPRLMYIVPDNFHPEAPPQSKKAARQQATFRKRVLNKRVVSKNFESPDKLAGAVAVDLMNYLVDKVAAGLAASTAGRPLPGQADAVKEAVAATAEGAAEGDERLTRALRLLEEGKTAEAEPLLRAVAKEREAQVAHDRKEAAAAYRHLGAIAGLREPKRAVEAYAKAVELDPDDIHGQFWLGWLQKTRGYLEIAQACFDRTLALAAGGKHNWHSYWAQLGKGDIEFARGHLGKALAAYRSAEKRAKQMSKDNLESRQWQRDLSVSYDRIGDVVVAQGKLNEALQSFRNGLVIRERLTKADSDNDGWQRDLSVSYNKIGDVLVDQGKRDEALQAYRDGLAIIDRLAKADPGNAEWQRDLSVSYNKIGDVLVEQGKRDEALQAFRDSLAIADRLAQADPANVQWQVDLLWSHWRLAWRGDEPARRWQLIVTTLRKLKAEDKLTAEQATWLPLAEAELAKVKGK